jgi:hypothetical protein
VRPLSILLLILLIIATIEDIPLKKPHILKERNGSDWLDASFGKSSLFFII